MERFELVVGEEDKGMVVKRVVRWWQSCFQGPLVLGEDSYIKEEVLSFESGNFLMMASKFSGHSLRMGGGCGCWDFILGSRGERRSILIWIFANFNKTKSNQLEM